MTTKKKPAGDKDTMRRQIARLKEENARLVKLRDAALAWKTAHTTPQRTNDLLWSTTSELYAALDALETP